MIRSFTDHYRFLSNFWLEPVWFEGMQFPSVENAYQAAKITSGGNRVPFTTISPGQAKRRGNKLKLRPDWESVKISIMRDLLEKKFQNKALRALLIATGKISIEEGNTWGDTFWGICKGVGENHLGKLLMEIREKMVQRPIQ